MIIPWTPEELSHLKTRWVSGASASEIARELPGRTRNAVIGAINRLCLPTRSNTPRKPKQYASRVRVKPISSKPKPPARTPARHKRTKPVPVPPTEAKMCCIQFVTETVRFADHDERKQCCWVIGEPRGLDTLYCAARQIAGANLCSYHYSIAWRSYEPKGRDTPLRREWAA